MKYLLLSACLFLGTSQLTAQVEGFENVTLDSGKVLNGINGELEYTFQATGFTTLHLPVFWDTSYGGFWSSGWAISAKQDSTTTASDAAKHLYCSKALTGVNGSKTYSIGQSGSFFYLDRGSNPLLYGFYITNTTYAYNSMKFGDAFGKKFGGSTGNDSDYFFCRVRNFMEGKLLDSQDVYLADYRFSSNAEDYILKDWKHVTMNFADSITFELFSSDTSSWGINTPAFFAIDNIEYGFRENVRKLPTDKVRAYPNPTTGTLMIKSSVPATGYAVFDMAGKKVTEGELQNIREAILNLNALVAGAYLLEMQTAEGVYQQQLQIVK